jgi:hypothetical protein
MPNLDLATALNAIDRHSLRRRYSDQDEFAIIPNLIPEQILEAWMLELQNLRPHIHRNFIPRHKKGGSVPYSTVARLAPAMAAIYHHEGFIAFLREITGAAMRKCPDSDPHRCALYAYTEEGDFIGWHYDTSYYKDRRWTVLAGLLDRSSSRLECRLHTRNRNGSTVDLSVQIAPGTVVLFNGDKVYHRVTPTQAGEERFVISMQYVTVPDMNPFLRFVSNMKDAIAYFGLRHVFMGSRKSVSVPRSENGSDAS